jgi:hypothetical protein
LLPRTLSSHHWSKLCLESWRWRHAFQEQLSSWKLYQM